MSEHAGSGLSRLFVVARALMELSRPGNVVMAAVGVAIGALVAGAVSASWDVGLAAVATVLVTAGGNALNDVTDRAIDERAHPDRPLPAGRLSVQGALAFAIGAFLLALAAASLVSLELVVLVGLAEAGLVTYERYLKASGLAGNLTVAGLVAATFVAGAIAHGHLTAPVGFLAGLAFLANVGREAFKDVEDAPHDVGRRTLAQRWGTDGARRFARAVTLAAVALSPLPALFGFGGWPYLAAVGVADVLFLLAVLRSDAGAAQRASKLAMVAALAAFALGAIA